MSLPIIEVCLRRVWIGIGLGLVVLAVTACGARPEPTPTRTPVPTYTATPEGAQPAPPAAAAVPVTPTPVPPDPPTPTPVPATPTPTPLPATDTPTPEPPTETPTVTPTPTATPTVTPTPTPDYAFSLEAAEQFPSQVADVDEVRIYLYVYDAQESYALEEYSLRVIKDNFPLVVQARSTGGLPGETRPGPSPYTRFANLGAAFFEEPMGAWTVQLLDPGGNPAGPPATFVVGENDPNREFYVRYTRKVQ